MLQPELPSGHDLVTSWPRYVAFPAFWGAGWLVSSTSVPPEWQGYVALGFVVGSTALLYGLAAALGIELSGGQCRARTNDGTRCQHPRPPGEDLCRSVHARMYDVELVDEAGEV